MQKRASQVFIYQKTCISSSHMPKNVQKTCKNVKNVQKRAFQMFLDPIQKRALSRSVQLEAMYFEVLVYLIIKMVYRRCAIVSCSLYVLPHISVQFIT